MERAATYPTDVKSLHFMLDEQRQLIESLKANLHRLLKWQCGPRSERVHVDQLVLFVDDGVVIEAAASAAAEAAERNATRVAPGASRCAVRVHRNLPRVIDQIDVPETQKICPCCDESMSAFGHGASERLYYIPARLEVHGTRRLKYACGYCHGAIVRAPLSVRLPIPKSMAAASLLAYLIASKLADGLPLYRRQLWPWNDLVHVRQKRLFHVTLGRWCDGARVMWPWLRCGFKLAKVTIFGLVRGRPALGATALSFCLAARHSPEGSCLIAP